MDEIQCDDEELFWWDRFCTMWKELGLAYDNAVPLSAASLPAALRYARLVSRVLPVDEEAERKWSKIISKHNRSQTHRKITKKSP